MKQFLTVALIVSSLNVAAFADEQTSSACAKENDRCTLDLGAAKFHLKRLKSEKPAYDVEGVDASAAKAAIEKTAQAMVEAGQAVAKGTVIVVKEGAELVSYVVEAIQIDQLARKNCKVDAAYCDLPLGVGNANLGNVVLKRTGTAHGVPTYEVEDVKMQGFVIDGVKAVGAALETASDAVVEAVEDFTRDVSDFADSVWSWVTSWETYRVKEYADGRVEYGIRKKTSVQPKLVAE